MSEIETLGQLDHHIVNSFYISTWHIDRQIQVLPLDVVKNVASISVLNHGEMGLTAHICETVEGRDDIGVRLQIDPLGDVLVVRSLSHDEFLAEVFVVDNVGRIAYHMFNLKYNQGT